MEHMEKTDPQVAQLIEQEKQRQASVLRLIPSENYASPAVMEATGSCLTNKYSEGYPSQRYYQGQEYIDQLEDLARQRARQLFGAPHANVQPYSGSPANMAAYLALVPPGGRVMGMELGAGGHLTHGAKVSFSGKYYEAHQYGLDPDSGRLNYDQIMAQALEVKPKLIFAGCSAYPRVVDFAAFRRVADAVGAYLVADISHISGLCATGLHPHPLPHAHVVTTTTHKLLRGPRGGMILCAQELAKQIDRAVFPGLQGGPHNNVTAAIAVAMGEALDPSYAQYCQQVVANAQALAQGLADRGFTLVTGGTDNHLVLVDLRPQGLTGKQMAIALEAAGMVVNANKIPFDPATADNPSGIRLGTPALTTRGMGAQQMEQIAAWMAQVSQAHQDQARLAAIRQEAAKMCAGFPAPGID